MKAIIATTVMGIIMMFAGISFKDRKGLATLACVLLAILMGVNIWDLWELSNAPKEGGQQTQFLYHYMLRLDRNSLWFNTLMTGCTLLYGLLSGRHIMKVGQHVAEYFALIFFILCGVFILS